VPSNVWCPCGSQDALIGANGNRTTWERDTQGRVTREIRADGTTDTLYTLSAPVWNLNHAGSFAEGSFVENVEPIRANQSPRASSHELQACGPRVGAVSLFRRD
jgi:YD repeat-containing protein